MSNYKDWNKAIAHFFFSPKCVVFLACDRETIVTIAKRNPGLADVDPVKCFTEAVKLRLNDRGGDKGHGDLNETPDYMAVLAFLVFCSFDNEEKGCGSSGYYKTLAFYSNMESHYLAAWNIAELWLSYEKWMNQTCQGENGIVRLPKKRRGPWYIVNMITSQATMRDHDLKLLPNLFNKERLEPGSLVAPTLMSSYIRGLSPHIDRCLQDERRDIVIGQACEYLKMWNGTIQDFEISNEALEKPVHESLKVWCQILKRQTSTLEGGLVDPQSNSLFSVGARGEMVSRLTKISIKGLLAVFNPMCGRYEEARSFSEGDRFLFFMPRHSSTYWREGLKQFSNKFSQFSSENPKDVHYLARLPVNITVLAIEVMEVVEEINDSSHWAGLFNTRHLQIKLSGGLPLDLREGVWLRGFGPRVFSKVDELYLDDNLLSQRGSFQNRLNKSWARPGKYTIKNWAHKVRVIIKDARSSHEQVPSICWTFCEGIWPELGQRELESSLIQLIGNNHKEMKGIEKKKPSSRDWIELNLQLRGLQRPKQSAIFEGMLHRCLALAVQRRFTNGG